MPFCLNLFILFYNYFSFHSRCMSRSYIFKFLTSLPAILCLMCVYIMIMAVQMMHALHNLTTCILIRDDACGEHGCCVGSYELNWLLGMEARRENESMDPPPSTIVSTTMGTQLHPSYTYENKSISNASAPMWTARF